MVKKVGPDELDVTLKFGGGLHTRASEDEIDPREAADGKNFQLDIQNRNLRNRAPFDLIGTVGNAAEIRGGGSLLKADGTVSTLFQAGDTVYEWDGDTTFTDKTGAATVSSTSKLRGHWRSHNWTLGDKILLTDLNLASTVLEWDGTTLSNTTFTNEAGSGFGNFFAKYLTVSNERAIFGHIKEAGGTFEHLMVGSERGDYTIISVSQRPASGVTLSDPWFLLAPDLKPINGLVEALGSVLISTEQGMIFNLTGSDATDFSFDDFYPGSAASGDESLAYIGNDVIYGRAGRIESVRDTDRFGDSEADDLTANIADQIEAYTGWRTIYNSRLNRVYLFPENQGEVWVFQTAMKGRELSPWMVWETAHPLDFQPTFVMSMLDPSDGLEYVFMGDASGNVYRLEGTGAAGDGGTTNIGTEWLSKLISSPLDAQAYEVEGYIKYRKNVAAEVELIFEYAGENIFNESVTFSLPALTDQNYWGESIYWGDSDLGWGSASGRLSRQRFFMPGQGNEFQVRVRSSGVNDIDINEIGIRLKASS